MSARKFYDTTGEQGLTELSNVLDGTCQSKGSGCQEVRLDSDWSLQVTVSHDGNKIIMNRQQNKGQTQHLQQEYLLLNYSPSLHSRAAQ